MADDEVIEIAENSEIEECDKTKDSDCEIQEVLVPVIEVDGSDDENCIEGQMITDLTEQSENKTDSDALFMITFNDEEKYQHLKEDIISGLRELLRRKGIGIDVQEDEELNIFFIKQELLAEQDAVEPTDVVEELEENEDKDESDSLFLIDTTPAEKIDVGTIPSYKRSIKDVLDNDAKKTKQDDSERVKLINSCFNCLGSHSLRDCPEPRNQLQINKARKQFMESRGDKRGDKRYHIDIEQRFAHLKPGHISNNLSAALGLRRGELPSFIYKMRVLGYPPGWLEEAKVAHSGIFLFDSEGRQVLGSDDEEGETDNEKHKYDINKIINFPGFNVDPGPDYFDDFNYYGVPPLQLRDRKEDFIKSLGDNILKGYKRKKLKNLCAPVEQAEIAEAPADMEIEDLDEEIIQYSTNPPLPPPLPEGPEVRPPPPPPEECPVPRLTPINQIDLEEPCDSPSLEDLEAKQRQLLEALKNSSSFLDATMQEDSLIDEVLQLEEEENEDETSQASEAISTQAEIVESNNLRNCPSPQTPAQKTNKKSSVLGTPLLKFSPYDKLPEGDLFKKGVSDVINFENLPDSTGKYDRIKVVIQKVRKIVTKLNEENS